MSKIFDLSLFGGRGAKSASSGNGGGGASSESKAEAEIMSVNTKFSTSELNSMSRSQLETVARAVFIKQNIARGLSASEADYRARSLMSGNTTAQLKKYIKRNG